ncbi:MAG: DUF2271 domain-containing protein [Tepidisphaeraceae bacterium]|jgi:thiamine biosynthesis lipoprotein ApbE
MKLCSTSWALAVGIAPAIVCAAPAVAMGEFDFHQDDIIGTSLDLLVLSKSPSLAIHCRAAALGEIERLRQILSIYDPASEISQVNRGGAIRSPELAKLLDIYRRWEGRTGGIIVARIGRAIAQWKARSSVGAFPATDCYPERTREGSGTEVQSRMLRGYAQHHDPGNADSLRCGECSARTASPAQLNVDALGKAFIIDRATSVAARIAPAGILNIGGDLRVWGDRTWKIGVADPHNPSENAPPIGIVELRNGAVATSGDYARGRHIIDPRTQSPARILSSATVVADDCVTANALATAACVAGEEAMQWRDESVRGWMLVDANGRRTCAGNVGECRAVALADKPALWPRDFQVSIQLSLVKQQGHRTHRPYVCIWVEAADGTVVRSVAVWGKERKYLRDMSTWWKATGGKDDLIRSVSRASREAGQYTVTWDGTDDKGAPLPKGDYTIRLEINREKGRHVNESVKLTCGDEKQSATIKATPESDATTIDYGPKTDLK